MFARVFVLLAILFVSACAFKPAPLGRVAASRAALKMSPTDVAVEATNVLSSFSQVLAEEETSEDTPDLPDPSSSSESSSSPSPLLLSLRTSKVV